MAFAKFGQVVHNIIVNQKTYFFRVGKTGRDESSVRRRQGFFAVHIVYFGIEASQIGQGLEQVALVCLENQDDRVRIISTQGIGDAKFKRHIVATLGSRIGQIVNGTAARLHQPEKPLHSPRPIFVELDNGSWNQSNGNQPDDETDKDRLVSRFKRKIEKDRISALDGGLFQAV